MRELNGTNMNNLPKTNREVLEHLVKNGAKENYVRMVAHDMSEDFFDEEPPDQFNRDNKQKDVI
jgi:hypothetical protein